MRFKLIKSVTWNTTAGKQGVTHVIAAKGRVVNLNPEDFCDEPTGSVTIGDGFIDITCPFEFVLDKFIKDGHEQTGAKIKPKSGFDFVSF